MRNFSSAMKTSAWGTLTKQVSRQELRKVSEKVESIQEKRARELAALNGHCVTHSNQLTVKVVKKAAIAAAKPVQSTSTSNLRAEVTAHQASKVNQREKARLAFAKLFA